MRKFLIAAALLVFTSTSLGVVGGPNASEGEMTITSGSSSSASTAVGPNGTEWRSSLENRENSCISGNQSQNIEFQGFQADGDFTTLNFDGLIQTSNPCVNLELNVSEESGDVYRIELVERSSDGVCVECVGAARFSGSFSAPGEYRAEVVNNGEVLGTIETPGFVEENSSGEDSSEPEGQSVWEGFSSIFKWFGSLF